MENTSALTVAQPDPYLTELLAMLERAIAYIFTGDGKVIVRALMGHYGLKRSLLELGLPAITRSIQFEDHMTTSFNLTRADWPVTRGLLAVASKRAQVLTYGEDHYKASHSRCAEIGSNSISAQ